MPPDLDTLTDQIRVHHRERVYAMEQRKRADLALGAFLRMALGWSLALPVADRKAIEANAMALIESGEKAVADKPFDPSDDFGRFEAIITASLEARAPFSAIEKQAVKAMGDLAKELPVWLWAEPIRGFGAVSLAVIVAETGDLSKYSNPAKVWKRMGVGIVGTVRQGGLPKTASKTQWMEHGYSPNRRARMWTIGDALIKGNRDGRYRAIYLDRKAYETDAAEAQGLTVAPSAAIPKGKLAEYRSVGHIHRRAQRYMEKRLLRDLWTAWNRQEDD